MQLLHCSRLVLLLLYFFFKKKKNENHIFQNCWVESWKICRVERGWQDVYTFRIFVIDIEVEGEVMWEQRANGGSGDASFQVRNHERLPTEPLEHETQFTSSFRPK